MGLGTVVQEWFLKIALKKGVKSAVSVILAAIASVKVAPILAQMGVTVDPAQLEIGLTALGTGLLTVALNFMKVKTAIGKKLL
jgi:hypothetical protein